jgi:acyl dehydratase
VNISPAIVGVTAGPLVQDIDARWLMAYAAGLGETAPEYLDTLRADGIVPHPLFSVCYEWPLMLELRARAFADDVALRSVHATHDLLIHRLVRPGDRLRTTARVMAVESRAPGSYVRVRLDTVDAAGEPVTVTEYGSLYLGVGCEGQAPGAIPAPPSPAGGVAPLGSAGRGGQGALASDPAVPGSPGPWWAVQRPVGATLAHVYSECARIWNPIHTDRAIARQAGLPDIILHGTATLALAVSAVLEREGPGAAERVRRVACRFGGMVRMPSALSVSGRTAPASADGRWVEFEAQSAEGRPAVRDGRLLLADWSEPRVTGETSPSPREGEGSGSPPGPPLRAP